MNTFIGYDVGTVEKSTGHSYIFFIADEVIGIPPLFIPFWALQRAGALFSVYDTGAKKSQADRACTRSCDLETRQNMRRR